MKTIDIIKIWNSYCIETNTMLDLIYPTKTISAKSLPYAYFMVSSIGMKYFKSDVDAIDVIDFSDDFYHYIEANFSDKFL